MNNIMNKILNCEDLWKCIIILYIGPRLFRCSELRSVSTKFSELFPPCHIKSKYIKVPSDKYKTLEDAYQYISDLLYGYCYGSGDYTKPPEIWLDCDTYENINNTIRIPVIIRGMGMDRTIIKNGFKLKINETWDKYIPPINPTLEGLSINNNSGKEDGILYSGIHCLYINSCKIDKCRGFGIKGINIKINIVNSIICNIKNIGIHLSYNSIINIDNLEIHNCGLGIYICNLNRKIPAKFNNIKVHHNNYSGISLTGWYPDSKIIITGDKTDISFNNLLKQKSEYGVKSYHSGKIIFKGLDKNVSRNNYNDQNFKTKHGGEIIFTS